MSLSLQAVQPVRGDPVPAGSDRPAAAAVPAVLLLQGAPPQPEEQEAPAARPAGRPGRRPGLQTGKAGPLFYPRAFILFIHHVLLFCLFILSFYYFSLFIFSLLFLS